jgi:3-hydroxyacyl-[acyl-carrier-protein] dehydratase
VEFGEDLSLESQVSHDGSGYAMTGTRFTIAGERVCDAKLIFRIMPFRNIDFREQIM